MMDRNAYRRYRQHVHIKLLEGKTSSDPGWTTFEAIHSWDINPGPAITRQAIQDLLRAGLIEESQQRPGIYRARGHKPARGPKEDTMTQTPTPAPDYSVAVRREALAKAIEHHEGEGSSAGQIVATAKAFEAYMTSTEETPAISHVEAIELNGLITLVLRQVRAKDATSIDPDDLERAHQITAALVADTEGAE